MKAMPAALSPVAILGAAPPSDKRPIVLSGADESVSNFEALLRATPGGRRAAVAANAHAADNTQLPLTESAGEIDLLGKASQGSASSLSRPGEKVDDESGPGLVIPEAVASSVLPFWPSQLGAAWGGALQIPASGADTPNSMVQTSSLQTGLVQTGLTQADPSQAEPFQAAPSQTGLAQASLVATAWGTANHLPEQINLAGSGHASSSASQTEIPVGFVMMDPARETLPALPVLPALSGASLSLSAVNQAPGRASAEVLVRAFNSDTASPARAHPVAPGTPIDRAVSGTVGLIPAQALPTPFAVSLSSAAAPKPSLQAWPGLKEAAGPRLSVEPRPLDSAAVVLAQFGAVSVVAKPHEMEQNAAPAALTDVQHITDVRGAWVPELGGMVSPTAKSTASVDFAQHLAEQVDTWVSQNLQVAELRLQEPSANPVLVRIEMNGQQASVMFRTDVLACQEALTTQIEQLSDLMSAQGLQLTDASVAGSGADAQSGREARPGPLWGEPAARRSVAETSGEALSPPRRGPTSAGRTLDVFV
jgi:flagellar hook-length control protein FliK